MEAIPAPSGGEAGKVLITSLYPRCVPLLRYEVGDEIFPGAQWPAGAGVHRFRAVAGRCNDYVRLPDGSAIHSEAFTHAMRSYPEVKGYQVVQRDSDIAIRILCAAPLPPTVRQGIQDKLARVHRLLATVPLSAVGQLETTIAGKTPMILKR